jgi:regulator of protease activity HflC (stomatin/prohibitin superfamily)
MKGPKIALGLIALFLVVVGGFVLLTERVPPTSIGVRQQQWGGSGVDKQDYTTGFHLGVTGFHKWYLLDRQTHFLTFSETPSGNSGAQQKPPLEIRTRDGNTAVIDVTVTYRIKPDEGHQIVAEGLRDVYRDRVMSTVESTLRGQLAELTSEDFYSTETRLERAVQTLPELEAALAPLHVVPEVILLRAVRFPQGYEDRLQEKQLTYQQKLLAEAKRKVEEQLQRTGTMEKEIEAAEKEKRGQWDKALQKAESDNQVAIAEILGDAEKYDRQTRAEADADYETMIAEGKLAIDKAEALRNELRNKALDTTGGSILLARQAAENLNIGEVMLNSNDPGIPTVIDIPALVELLIGETEGE